MGWEVSGLTCILHWLSDIGHPEEGLTAVSRLPCGAPNLKGILAPSLTVSCCKRKSHLPYLGLLLPPAPFRWGP